MNLAPQGGVYTLILMIFVSEVHADSSASPVMGKRQFAPCSSCHTIESDGSDRVGPSLHGLFGRRAGSVSGFVYSEAMRKSEIVWNERVLDEFIKKPSAIVPGTKMAFAGMPQDQARADVIAYLKEATK
jgi:cytochrome c